MKSLQWCKYGPHTFLAKGSMILEKSKQAVFAWPKPAPLLNDRSGSALRVSVPTFRWTFRRDLFNYCDPDESGNISMEEFQDVFWVKWVPYLEELCVFFSCQVFGEVSFPHILHTLQKKDRYSNSGLQTSFFKMIFYQKKLPPQRQKKETNPRNFLFCQPSMPSKQDLPRRFSWETNKQSNQPPPTPIGPSRMLGTIFAPCHLRSLVRRQPEIFFGRKKHGGNFLGGRCRQGSIYGYVCVYSCLFICICIYQIICLFLGETRRDKSSEMEKLELGNSKKKTYWNRIFWVSFSTYTMVMVLHRIPTFVGGFNPDSTFFRVHTGTENIAMLLCSQWLSLTMYRTLDQNHNLSLMVTKSYNVRSGEGPHPTRSQGLDER